MKTILQFLFILCIFSFSTAQTVILDFETDATSASFGNFGPDGPPSLIIENPNKSGINESEMVLEYVDRAGSELWAGIFADVSTPIVATPGGKICLDAHFDHLGKILLKLEEADNGGPNWEVTQTNVTMNEWEQMCFSFDQLDQADPSSGQSAVGTSYNKLVLFFDFGDVPATDIITYVDNVVVEGGVLEPVDLSFTVDMSGYGGTFNQVFLSGTFNDWSGNSNPMTDNGDGTWSTTVNVPGGPIEWKFQVDEWSDSEQFRKTDKCVVVINDGEFINRKNSFLESGDVPTVCWASCYACGASTTTTFNLAVPNPSPDGVYLAGGAEFGAPGGLYGMSDDDGDGVYSIEIERLTGFETFYTFANGNCPDYSCKEDISGQDCSDPDNFNDRFLTAGTTEVNTCFGQCTEMAECVTAPMTMMTFTVDMSEQEVHPEGVKISGEMIGWTNNGDMTDNGDGTWSITYELEKKAYEYKFKNGPDGWETLEAGTSCTVTTPDGAFTNRVVDLTDSGDDESTIDFCFESCAVCTTSTDNVEADNSALEIYPTLILDNIEITLARGFSDGQLMIFGINGEKVYQTANVSQRNVIDASDFNAGIYIVTFASEEYTATQKIVKQ